MFLELKQAIRWMVRHPGYSVPMTLVLALGIGSTVSVFTLINGALLAQPPFPLPERLLQIIGHERGGDRRISKRSRGCNGLTTSAIIG